MSGYDNSSFGPTDTITREQMAAMLYNYEVKFGAGGFTGAWMFRLPFTALTEISEWAYEGVAWCYMKDVITGKSTDLFDPKEKATRAEIAAILTQYLKLDERRINKPLKHKRPAARLCRALVFSLLLPYRTLASIKARSCSSSSSLYSGSLAWPMSGTRWKAKSLAGRIPESFS